MRSTVPGSIGVTKRLAAVAAACAGLALISAPASAEPYPPVPPTPHSTDTDAPVPQSINPHQYPIQSETGSAVVESSALPEIGAAVIAAGLAVVVTVQRRRARA